MGNRKSFTHSVTVLANFKSICKSLRCSVVIFWKFKCWNLFLRLCMTRTAPQFKPLIKFTYICYVLYFPFSHSYLYANSHIFKLQWPCRVADFAPDHFISNLTETERLLLETSMLEEETKAVKQYLWLQPIWVKRGTVNHAKLLHFIATQNTVYRLKIRNKDNETINSVTVHTLFFWASNNKNNYSYMMSIRSVQVLWINSVQTLTAKTIIPAHLEGRHGQKGSCFCWIKYANN